jgi:hypothetical protein
MKCHPSATYQTSLFFSFSLAKFGSIVNVFVANEKKKSKKLVISQFWFKPFFKSPDFYSWFKWVAKNI